MGDDEGGEVCWEVHEMLSCHVLQRGSFFALLLSSITTNIHQLSLKRNHVVCGKERQRESTLYSGKIQSSSLYQVDVLQFVV